MCNGASAEIRGLGVWNSPMSAERYFITSYCIWFLGNIHRPVWQRNVFRIYRYIQCDMWCSYQRFISSKKCSRRTFTKLECRLLLTCNSSGNIRTKYNIPKTYNTVLTLYNQVTATCGRSRVNSLVQEQTDDEARCTTCVEWSFKLGKAGKLMP